MWKCLIEKPTVLHRKVCFIASNDGYSITNK